MYLEFQLTRSSEFFKGILSSLNLGMSGIGEKQEQNGKQRRSK